MYKVEIERGCFRILKINKDQTLNTSESSLNISRTIGDLKYKQNKSLSSKL